MLNLNKSFLAKTRAFSLIELLVTMAIIAILLAIGLPSFQNTISRNRMETEANNLLRDFSFARTEAIKRGESVTLCPSINATSCSNSQDYGDGWIIFVDTNENGTVDGEEILRVIEDPADSISINGTINGVNYICYTPNGMLC